jgi:hypothetical protein
VLCILTTLEDDAGLVQTLNYQLPFYHRSAVIRANLSRVGVLLCFGHAQGIDFKKDIKMRCNNITLFPYTVLKHVLRGCDFKFCKRLWLSFL